MKARGSAKSNEAFPDDGMAFFVLGALKAPEI
jgi:hypothetical protein